MNNHTTARIGSRVHVVLHDGTRFIDKLKENRARYYVFESHGRVLKEDVRSFSRAKTRRPVILNSCEK